MKLAIVILLALAFVSAATIDHTPEEKKQWEEFRIKYAKEYSPSEEATRFVNFIENLRKIKTHNESGKSFTLKINKFGDWTHDEYKAFLKASSNKGGKFHRSAVKYANELPTHEDVNVAEVDWRKVGAVTPVKDQGQCGSCYAFSATGAIEGQYAIKYSKLASFSESQFVDCSDKYGNQGCNGGLVEYCYNYSFKAGLMLEEDYGYNPEKGECRYDADKVAAKVVSYFTVQSGNEQVLTQQLAKVGPVAIGIDASNWSFQFYDSGVYDEPNCGNHPWELDHGVLAVGYGIEDETNTDYYIVKNSWGADWGNEGYIYMSRNKDNQCGIATDAIIPSVV